MIVGEKSFLLWKASTPLKKISLFKFKRLKMPRMKLFCFVLCSATISFALSISEPAQASDSRCPPGMNSPDGNVCVPGESMYDEIRAIQNRPPNFLPPRDRELEKLQATTNEMRVRVTELLKLFNDPDYIKYRTGKWKLLPSPKGEKKGQYCNIFFSKEGVILTLAGPGGDYKGAGLIFMSADIPRPKTQEVVEITLTQNNEPPVTVKAFNYSNPDHSFGSIAVAVPTIDTLLANMEDVQYFDLQIDGKSVAKITWHSGLTASAELSKCVNGKPYAVTEIDLLGK